MSDPQLWNQVRELIRDQEIGVAIRIMEEWLKGRLDHFCERRVSDWLDELLLHSANFNRIANRARKGLLAVDSESVSLNKLSLNLLALVRIIEGLDLRDPSSPPVMTARITNFSDGFEKILGTKSRLQMVSWLQRGLEISTAVCRLISNETRGTGFRIPDDLIVTNNHVISSRDQVTQFGAQFFFEEQLDGTIRDPLLISLDQDRFWTSRELDVTIVGARFPEGQLGKQISVLSMREAVKAEIGDPVTIIQHPLGGPKQIALTDNNIIEISGNRLRYLTDTLPGSSGSPVFTSRWELIAVHHAGGMALKDSTGQHHFANEGILVQAMLSDPLLKPIFD
jgi:V8-like Glu-specific endopeptidase